MRAAILLTATIIAAADAGAASAPGALRTLRHANGSPRLEAQMSDSVFHGTYRTWYPSGRPYEVRHFVHGREHGRQQSWTEDGTLFLNYEMRDGRRFGMVNAQPCAPAGEARR